MNHGETITDMQKRFAHLANRLNALGKPVFNEIATNKMLRWLNREWQQKVTVIKKLKKEKNKEKEVDNKSISLITSSSKSSTKEQDDSGTSDDECSDAEEIELFVKRYHKYIKKNWMKDSDKNIINYRRH